MKNQQTERSIVRERERGSKSTMENWMNEKKYSKGIARWKDIRMVIKMVPSSQLAL